MIKTEAKVGIFVLISIILLFFMTLRISGVKKIESKGKIYVLKFKNVSGLVKKAKVEVAGVECGLVEKISLTDDGKALVTIKVNPKIKLKKDAEAYVRSYGFMGEKYIELSPGKSDEILPEGSVILNTYSEKSIGEVADRISIAVDEFSKFMKNLNASMGEIGKNKLTKIINNFDNFSSNLSKFSYNLNNLLVNNRKKIDNAIENFDNFSLALNKYTKNFGTIFVNAGKTFKNFAEISERINKGEGTLGKLIVSDEMYKNINSSFKNLSIISENIAKGKGTLGKLVTSEEFYNDIKLSLQGIKKVTDLLSHGKGTFGKLLTDESVYNDLKISVENLKNITTKINEGKGTFGKIVNDEQMYNEIRNTLLRIQKAADGISEQTPISTFGTIMGTLF